MPKKKLKRSKQKKKTHQRSSSFAQQLRDIDNIIEDGDKVTAFERLKVLAQSAPRNVDVFERLFDFALDIGDRREALMSALRLVELRPAVPEYTLNLYAACIQNVLPALGLQTARRFLQHWKDSEVSAELAENADEIETMLRRDAARWGLSEEHWLEVMTLHDKVQIALWENDTEEVRALADELIALYPDFIPVYNNRSLANFSEGRYDDAIEDERRALEIDPENVHALSNLTRYLFLNGQNQEARETAEKLLKVDVQYEDGWTKKVEALSYLGDDEAVLTIAEQAHEGGATASGKADPLMLHLIGVASARLGHITTARHYFTKALELEPTLLRIRENLEDLDKPPGEQNGAWAFNLNEWIAPGVVEYFIETVGDVESPSESENLKYLEDSAKALVKQYPYVPEIVTVLLERGNSFSRSFALSLSQLVRTPELLAAVKHFTSSPYGADKDRFNALRVLNEEGIVEVGERVPFWSGGTKTEIIPSWYRIDDEPYEKLKPEAVKFVDDGIEASRNGELDRAEKHFHDALQVYPKSASIQYNLAIIEIQRGNILKARSQLQGIAKQHPAYSLPKTQLALIEMVNDRMTEAGELLKNSALLGHFHYMEFAAFCKAQICLTLLEHNNYNDAERWFNMWKESVPEDPMRDNLLRQIGRPGAAQRRVRKMLEPLSIDKSSRQQRA